LAGLLFGAISGALLALHAPTFAPAIQLLALTAALCAAGWQAYAWRLISKDKRASGAV